LGEVVYIGKLYILSLALLLISYSITATPELSHTWTFKPIKDIFFPDWAQVLTIRLAKEEAGWGLTIHLRDQIPKPNQTIFTVALFILLDSDGNPETGREYFPWMRGIECTLSVMANPHINLTKLFGTPSPASLYCEKEGVTNPPLEFRNSKTLIIHLPEYAVKTENLSSVLRTPIGVFLFVFQGGEGLAALPYSLDNPLQLSFEEASRTSRRINLLSASILHPLCPKRVLNR